MSSTSENNKRIAKNTAMLYIRMLLIMAVTLYTSRVVLEVLGVEDFGIYNVVGGIVVMFSFLNGSMASATQRFLSFEIGRNDWAQLKKIFSLTVNIHILIAIVIFLLAETIGLWFLNNQMNIPSERMQAARWVYQFSIYSFIISVLQIPYNAAIIAREQMNVYAYISIIEVLLKLLVVLLLTHISYDKLKLYSILLFCVSLLIAIIYRIYCKFHFTECRYHFVWDKSISKTMIGYAGWNLLGHVALIMRTQGINILLNIYFGPVLNAARGIAVQVNSAILTFVTNFQTAVNPQIVKSFASNDLAEMRKLILQSSKYSFLLLFLLTLPILLETEFLLELWLKRVPDYGILFCRLMLIATLTDVLSGTLGYGALATGRVRLYWLVLGGLLLLDLPLSYVFLKSGYPPYVVFAVEIALYIVALFVRLVFLHTMISFSIPQYIRQVLERNGFVVLISLLVPLYFYSHLDRGWFRFIIVASLSVFSTLMSIYYIGLNKKERILIVDLLRSRFLKLKRR